MRKTRRTYKDSLFRDIFNNEKRLPEIYECLEGASADIHDIRLTTMDEVFFDSEKKRRELYRQESSYHFA